MYRLEKLKEPHLGKKRSKVWLKQAQFDLKAAEVSLDNGFHEWATYQSEQAVEKSLKAVIVDAGYISPKSHKLSVLIGICNRINNHFRNTKFTFRFIDTFTLISRYPFLIPGREATPHELISFSEAQTLIKHSKQFLEKVEFILGAEKSPNGRDSEAYDYDVSKIDINRRVQIMVTSLTKVFNVDKIIIFGSFARNLRQDVDNTMDVLIIAETDLSFVERIKLAREVTKGYQPSIEPLVYTPNEFKFMIEEEGEGFLEKAAKNGKVVFENPRNQS